MPPLHQIWRTFKGGGDTVRYVGAPEPTPQAVQALSQTAAKDNGLTISYPLRVPQGLSNIIMPLSITIFAQV